MVSDTLNSESIRKICERLKSRILSADLFNAPQIGHLLRVVVLYFCATPAISSLSWRAQSASKSTHRQFFTCICAAKFQPLPAPRYMGV